MEFAKRLKELGVKQNSYFWWFRGQMPNVGKVGYVLAGEFSTSDEKIASAFTPAELGEILPLEVNIPWKGGRKRKNNHRVTFAHWPQGWKCGLNHNTAQFYLNIIDNTEADARAKMLIYLIENGLVKPDSI